MLSAEEIKRRLVALRELRGMSQRDLALKMQEDGWGLNDLGKIERGDPKIPFSRGRRRSAAEHLHVREEWFTEPDLDLLLGEPPEIQLDRVEAKLDFILAALELREPAEDDGPARVVEAVRDAAARVGPLPEPATRPSPRHRATR